MKHFAALHNALIDTFHYSIANQPERYDLYLHVLKRGMNNLFCVAQAAGQLEDAKLIVESCTALMFGDVPELMECDE